MTDVAEMSPPVGFIIVNLHREASVLVMNTQTASGFFLPSLC